MAHYLVISQAYVPDPTSVGQHMADAAAELARRGHRVTVIASARGFGDATQRYPRRERRDGVDILRIPLSSFGKSSILIRLLSGFLFTALAVLRGLTVGRAHHVFVSTCPPMAGLAGLCLGAVHRAPVTYWLMDLNPDQIVAMGQMRPGALPARAFEWMNRLILWRADRIVVPDRFMAERVVRKLDVRPKLAIIPPWALEDHLVPIPHEENPCRAEWARGTQRIVMYSGNHSPCNPLGTLLEATTRLQSEAGLKFLFVGGGSGKREVEAHGGPNIASLPYEPLERLRFSLSAADVHVVSLGDEMVGILHPSKVYGAMAVGRPILFLGPDECHVADLMRQADIGWHIPHGDVDRAEAVLRDTLAAPLQVLAAKGQRARELVTGRLSKAALCGQLVDLLERKPLHA